MQRLFDVYLFHFLQAVKSKGFIISSSIIVVLLLGFFTFSAVTSGGSNANELKFSVYNTSENYQFDITKIQTLLQSTNSEYEYVLVTGISSTDIDQAIKDEKVDGAVYISEQQGEPVLDFTFENTPYQSLVFATESIVKDVKTTYLASVEGVDQNILAQVQTPITSTIHQVDEITVSMTTSMLIYVFAFFFYIFALTFGNLIASNIVSEKSSRVMEVMISKVKPLTLMYGKILAILSLGIVQLFIIGATIGTAALTGLFDMNSIGLFGVPLDFSALTPMMIGYFIIFLLLGFGLYAILFAAVGASVSKMEQLGNATFPVVLFAIGAFFIGMSAMSDPTSTLVSVSAYVPFFSPIAEYARILAGVAQPIEIALSIAILVMTILVVNKIAARVYVNGVMSYQEKWTWKTLWSLVRQK